MDSAPLGGAEPRGWRSSKAFTVVAAGYAVEAMGLMAFLTINSASSVPPLAIAATIVMIAAGFLLPAAAMVALSRIPDVTLFSARNSFLLQGSGPVALLLGVVLAEGLNSLIGFQICMVLLATSAASGMLGAISLRKNQGNIDSLGQRMGSYLVLGTTLLFSGVGVIMASNTAFYFLISGSANAIYTDMGAMISACGCAAAAYSFYGFHDHSSL